MLRNALTQSGFLNPDGCIHDWEDYVGRLLVKRQANRDRAKKAYQESTHSLRAENKSLQIVCEATVPNPTVPNPTEQNMTKETITATIPLHSTKPVSSNGEERPLEAVASKAGRRGDQSQPLQPYEIQFLEIFEFRSGRFPKKLMREYVGRMVDKYGAEPFLAAARKAVENNVPKLAYVEGILKKGGTNARPSAGSGRGRGPDNLAKPGKYAQFAGQT